MCSPQYRGINNNISVGNFTAIGLNCIFDGGFGHNYKNVTSFPLHKLDGRLPSNVVCKGDIVIGNDVWIGEDCVIMSGVTIGDGAVIGARSIVCKDLPPYRVQAGDKYWERFNTATVYKLLGIKWWNWTDERVLKNAHLLLSEDITKFIENYA